MSEDLSLQLASLKEALEKQTRLLAADAAIAELQSIFRVETVDALVPAVKERLAHLYAEVEAANRRCADGIEHERRMYAHYKSEYESLRSKNVQYRDMLKSAELRIEVLEGKVRLLASLGEP
jgi:hypothetical protein